MPLVAATLIKQVADAFKAQAAPTEVAQKIAEAYEAYARTGMAAAALPVLTGAEKTVYANTIAAAIASPQTGNPALFAQALALGAMAFWTLPPVIFSTPPLVGAATVMPGAPAAQAAMTAALSNISPGNTEDVVAQAIGTALDIATKTCVVVFSAPLPVLPPVTIV